MLAAGVAAPAIARADARGPTPPTLDELLREPHLRDAAISPDGEQLAILRTQPQGGKTTAFVTLSHMQDLSAQPALVKLGEHNAEKVEWANNERLLIWLTFEKDERGRPYGLVFYGTFVPIPVRRVVSVDLQGQNSVVMFSGNPSVLRRGYDASRVVDYMKDDPRRILMQAWNEGRGAYALYAVDVYTGEAEMVEQGAPATDTWLTQGGVPMLRLDSNARGTVAWVYGRAPGDIIAAGAPLAYFARAWAVRRWRGVAPAARSATLSRRSAPIGRLVTNANVTREATASPRSRTIAA